MAAPAPIEILRLLVANEVDFIVVGMVAGVLRGAPVATLDLDIVLSEGLLLRVIDLPTLIELKEKTGRPKDLADLPVLRATLAEARRRT